MKPSKDLLKRLDAILNEMHEAIEDMNPDGKAAGLLFEPVNELGWAVDELLGRHKATTKRPTSRQSAAP